MEFTRAQDKPRSGVTHCWRAINTCCASQAGIHLALTFCNEVSFLLQWEMVARLATAWQQPLCSPVESKAGCGVIYGFGEGWQALAAVTISRVT